MNAHPNRPEFDAPPAAMREAGAWVARRDRGLSVREEAEFQAWLEANPQHRAAFLQLERTSTTFGRLRELATGTASEPNPDLFAPRRRASRWLAPAVGAAGFAAAAALAVLLWPGRSAPPVERHLVTAAAGYQREVLSDGSVIDLNADTAVDVEFTSAERRARLVRGEAHFRITKNPARPFVVSANSIALRVIGTAFNVRMNPASVEVLVTEGTVEVDSQGAGERGGTAAEPRRDAPRLTAGQRIVVNTAAGAPAPVIASVTPDEIQRRLAWQPRIGEFHRTPLADVVTELNRQSGGRYPRIVIRGDDLASLRIGGNFRLDEPEAFVRLLESSFGIAAERTPEEIVLSKAR